MYLSTEEVAQLHKENPELCTAERFIYYEDVKDKISVASIKCNNETYIITTYADGSEK